jgi:hypothetical protein
MKLASITLSLTASALLAACATQQAQYDFDDSVDFAQYRRWAWLPQPNKQASGDPRIDNPLIMQRIESAVERNLAAKGFKQTESGEDFEVGYLVTVEKQLSSSGVGGSFGFGRYSGGSGVGMSFGGPQIQIREYEEGTLILEITDASSDKLVWHGSSTSRLSDARTPEDSERIINQMVEEILANFPPPASG